MRILMCGDIVGRPGREAVARHVPHLRQELALDFVIVNGENAAHGFGITDKICAELYACGVDVITTGNHVWDRREIMSYIGGDPRLLRPLNYPPSAPGNGFGVYALADGRRVLVANAMARCPRKASSPPASIGWPSASRRLRPSSKPPRYSREDGAARCVRSHTPRGRYVPRGGCPCRSPGFGIWLPPATAGHEG